MQNALFQVDWGFPGDSDGKEFACNAGYSSSIPELGRSPGERMATNSSILAWRISWMKSMASCSLWGHKEFDTTEQLTLLLPFSGTKFCFFSSWLWNVSYHKKYFIFFTNLYLASLQP